MKHVKGLVGHMQGEWGWWVCACFEGGGKVSRMRLPSSRHHLYQLFPTVFVQGGESSGAKSSTILGDDGNLGF